MGHFERLDRVALLHEIGSLIHRCEGTVALGDDIRTALKNTLASVGVTDNELSYIMATSEEERGQLASVEKNTLEPIQLARRILGVASSSEQESNKLLRSIFTVFGNTSDKPTLVYPMTADKNLFQYPVNTHIEVDEDALINIWKRFLKKLKNDNCDNMDYLSAIFEAVGKGIPGDTTSGSISDVSVYIQSKMVAAVAVCLADYAEEANISLESLVVEVDNNDKENNSAEAKPFMILSGDFSGIQNFIYTIPSKGALKSLRGRSFYLELFMEYAVDSFLKKLNLSRSHVLYTGGGHFYLIIPNTKASRIALTEFESAVNTWLLKHMGSALYLAIGSAACTIGELQESSEQRNVFASVGESIRLAKLQRYAHSNLDELFDENSQYNVVHEDNRECSVCRTSTVSLEPYGDSDDKEACPICSGLFKLGEYLVQSESSCFVIATSNARTNRVGVPIFGDNRSLYVIAESDLAEFVKFNAVDMIYGKNHSILSPLYGRALILADYASRYDSGDVLDFVELANRSGENGQGIARIGVLRADVDNLGAAFIGGFVDGNKENPLKYASLVRQAELSKSLSRFFKQAVNDLAYGETNNLPSEIRTLPVVWKSSSDENYAVHVIYSGGDDVFMVGAWNELLDLAIRMRKAFAYYTGGKITLSAGLALFTPKYPIDKMADITGALESAAKSNPSKNSIALGSVK